MLLAPGMGDGIQAAKAGILEIGDLFVVNKADRDGAQATVRDLRNMISLGQRTAREEAPGQQVPNPWRPQVLPTVASTDTGIAEVADAIEQHLTWLRESGTLHGRRSRRAANEIVTIALHTLRTRLGALGRGSALASRADDVVSGRTDPFAAAEGLVGRLISEARGEASERAATAAENH